MPLLLGNKSPRLVFGQSSHLSISFSLKTQRDASHEMSCLPYSYQWPRSFYLVEAKLCLMKWELGWVSVPNSNCLELLFPVPANLVSAGLSLSRWVSYRPQPGGEGAEKGFLGGLGLNEYRPLLD